MLFFDWVDGLDDDGLFRAVAARRQVSGVIAVVILGLVWSRFGKLSLSKSVEESMHNFWTMLGFIMNTLIFILSGVIISAQWTRPTDETELDSYDWGMLFILYVLLHIVRFTMVFQANVAINDESVVTPSLLCCVTQLCACAWLW